MTTYAVRMRMTERDAVELADLMDRCPPDVADRVQDQFWLKTVFVEQRRRTDIAERNAFDDRADRILEALDPVEAT